MNYSVVGVTVVNYNFITSCCLGALPLRPRLRLAKITSLSRIHLGRFTSRRRIEACPSARTLLTSRSIRVILGLAGPEGRCRVSGTYLRTKGRICSRGPLTVTVPRTGRLMTLTTRQNLRVSSTPYDLLKRATRAM